MFGIGRPIGRQKPITLGDLAERSCDEREARQRAEAKRLKRLIHEAIVEILEDDQSPLQAKIASLIADAIAETLKKHGANPNADETENELTK